MSATAAIRSIFAPGSAYVADEQVRRENLAIAEGLKRQQAGLLDELIVRYQHRLLRYLLFLTGNREMAEDLFQEVWMRVLTRGGQFNGKARFETWLFTIARNLVIDYRRKRTMSSLDELFETGNDDDKPMTFEVADGRADALRPVLERRGPRTHFRGAVAAGHALPRGTGAALPRGADPGGDLEGDPVSAFDREIPPLSRTERD